VSATSVSSAMKLKNHELSQWRTITIPIYNNNVQYTVTNNSFKRTYSDTSFLSESTMSLYSNFPFGFLANWKIDSGGVPISIGKSLSQT